MKDNQILDDIEERPKLYSKVGILMISIFILFFGALAYANNLRSIGKTGSSLVVIIGSIIYVQLGLYIFQQIHLPLALDLILVNLTGGLLLTLVVWPIHFGDTIYEPKPVWSYLMIVFGFIALLIALNYFS